MTTTPVTATVPIPQRLDVDSLAPTFSSALEALDNAATAEADRAGLDHRLRELVRLRASQLNGCAYCVDLHSRAARSAGASSQQVDAVAVWHESELFTSDERVALELAEQVTLIATTKVPREYVDAAVTAFGPDGACALIALLVAINAWNAVGVTARPWPVTVRARD